jgi:hypothetical protein
LTKDYVAVKIKTVSGKVSRGGSHDTMEDGLFMAKIACVIKKVNPCGTKNHKGELLTPEISIPTLLLTE